MDSRPRELPVPDDALTNETFRLLVESVRDYAIFMLDPDGRVLTWNRGAQRIKGYRADEIIGRHFSIFYPQEDIEAGKCEYELEMAEKVGSFEDENWRLRKDGTRFWANVVITAMRSADGVLRGFAKVTRDLTERRESQERLRQSEVRLRLLVESIRDYAVFMLDPRGMITTWNTGAQNITQYRADEVIGRHFSIFYPPEGIELGYPERELEVATATGRYEEEGLRVRKDGSTFPCSVVLSAIRDEHRNLIGFAKVTRDLTERRAAEREQRARLAAEETNKAKDEFLATLGHELRNPLAPTLTAVHLLKLRSDGRSARELGIIERQVKHMVRLVDDLLDVARVTRKGLELKTERLDLRSTIARAIEIVSPLVEERRHYLDVDVPGHELPVHGDPVRLAQVFANILTNAAKYTEPEGRLRLSVRTDAHDAVIAITDNGAGIAPEILPRIFETFVQAPQHAGRNGGGLGIGLSVVRSLVQLHGGTVEAHSAGTGRGSTFVVRLPLSDQPAVAPPASGEVPVAAVATGRKVLMVDDNEDALETGAEVLRLAGHQVSTATSGEAALSLLQTFTPEVAVLDLGLPGISGHDLAGRLRASLGPRVRLIAVTGYGQESDRERSRQAGFDAHLIKPVPLDALLHSIESR